MTVTGAASALQYKIIAGVLLTLLYSSHTSAAQDMSLFGGRKLGLVSHSRSLAETVNSYAASPSLSMYYGPYGGYGMAGYGFSYGASSYGAGSNAARIVAPAPAPAPGPMPDMAEFPLPAPVL